jgi:hypothetical protein
VRGDVGPPNGPEGLPWNMSQGSFILSYTNYYIFQDASYSKYCHTLLPGVSSFVNVYGNENQDSGGFSFGYTLKGKKGSGKAIIATARKREAVRREDG